MKKNLLLLTALLFILPSCSKGGSTDSISGNSSLKVDNNFVDVFSSPSLKNSEEYLTFWNNESVIKISLRFKKESLQGIEECGVSNSIYQDYYFPCDMSLTVNDKNYEFKEVGARRKGNLSRNDDFAKGRIHYKLSFQETFDEVFYRDRYPSLYVDWSGNDDLKKEREERTLFDMKKIDLKWNRNQDETYLRQNYTNHIFSRAGVIASNTAFGIVNIYSDDNLNVAYEPYDIIECIDKVKIKRYFTKEASKGDLYKLSYNGTGKVDFRKETSLIKNNDGYTINSQYVGKEDTEKGYHPPYDIKTNKKTSTHEDLIKFIATLNDDTRSSDEFESTLESLVDLRYTAKYLTYSWAVGDPDDLRCNYNNSYIYFDSVNHRAYLIPYDHDRSLGVTKDGVGLLPSKRITTTKCTGYSGDSYQTNPLFYRTCIISHPGDTNINNLSKKYKVSTVSLEYIKEELLGIKNGDLFKTESFDSYLANNGLLKFLNTMIDSNTKNSDSGNNSYSEYYSNLLKMIEEDNSYLF